MRIRPAGIKFFVVFALFCILASTVSGCSSPLTKNTEAMMKALPAGTDSLFILNYNYITSLTPFMNIWNNLAGGLLPEKSIPRLLGMASSGGVLNSLMFTFESPTSIGALFPAHEYINRYIYQKTEIVKFDNGLDAFMYDGMLVVVMMGTAEKFLKEASDP